jgi:hypothetical protein
MDTNYSLATNVIHSISKGELLLVCMSILGVNIGELLKEDTRLYKTKISLIASSFFIGLFTTYSFAEISTNNQISSAAVASTSFWTFIATILICLGSILLPKIKH